MEPLNDAQLTQLETALHLGSAQASQVLAQWLAASTVIELDSVRQLPVAEAADVLGGPDQTLCFVSMSMSGALSGQIVLAFDDARGLSLSDLLLDRPLGTATEWGELEQSAALETTNIIGSAYLNSLAAQLSRDEAPQQLLPSPPTFRREFAESMMQALFIDQAVACDVVFVGLTKFEIRGQQLDWNLLFVPDGPSLSRLRDLMAQAG